MFLCSSSRPGLECGTPYISGFSILSANPPQNHVLLGSHFAFPCSKPAPRPWDLRCAHFSIRDSPFRRHIGTGNLPYGTLLVLRIRLQMETGFRHYSCWHRALLHANRCLRLYYTDEHHGVSWNSEDSTRNNPIYSVRFK